ncbi:MAG: hypothetical protein IPL52_08640, partial [Flavobacteriales bacterium]|nr:hypothetical protein [Flavobacteriales bacterium]
MRTVATGGAYHKVVRDGALVRLWYWVRGFVLVPVSGGGPDPDKEIPLKV